MRIIRTRFLTLVLTAMLSTVCVAQSQRTTGTADDVQRWKLEKVALVEAVDKVEAKLQGKFRKWKTTKKTVLIPPEWLSEFCNGRLIGKGPAIVEVKIDWMNSAELASKSFYQSYSALASGVAEPVSNLGAEAVSLVGGYPMGFGQVGFLKDRFIVWVDARTPREAIEIAGIVEVELNAIISRVPKVD